MGTIRTFLAFDLDDSAHALAAGVLARLRSHPGAPAATWVRPEGLHITLRFLGPTDESAVPELGKMVRACLRREGPVAISLGGLGGFNHLKEARVIFLTVHEPAGRLAALFERVEAEVVRRGFAPETRAYHPHLTLARLRAPSDLRPWVSSQSEPDLTPGAPLSPALLGSVTLFRSDSSPGGAIYTPLERISLG